MSVSRAAAPVSGVPTTARRPLDAARPHVVDFVVVTVAVAAAVAAARSMGLVRHVSLPACLLVVALAAAAAAILLGISRRRADAAFADAIDRLQRIAKGDLLAPAMPIAQGSIGRAAVLEAATGDIVGYLRQLLTEADRGAGLLGEGWRVMNDVAWSMMNTSEGTVAEVAAAANAATEVSENMQFIASATDETTATMRSVAAHAADASVIGQSGVEQITAAGSTVDDLQTASKRVGDVLQLINGVARQTHLLALNATIEAARAGEHGRGFTVVASEVKELAQKTAQATGDVTATMREIETGSQRAAASMHGVSETIFGMSERQHSIAVAVEQQTATTQAIARSTADAAGQAVALATSVKSLTHAVRLGAYAGAKARSVAADVADIEKTIRTIVGRFQFEPVVLVADERGALAPAAAVTVDGVTVVENDVIGEGINAFSYEGTWGHARGNLEAAGTNSHSSMPGDVCRLRFVGTRVRFYGVVAPNHGMATIVIDGQEPVAIDQYAEQRAQGVLGWQSPVLSRGEHRLEITVLGQSNPSSRYVWVNIDRVEIDN
jgi:methyl-accepting chemotaxis protein